jgi:hypothetical protein
MHLGAWDLVLLLAVILQSTVVAYLHDPRHKAIILCIPLPFTIAVLALGRPIDATYLLGMPLLILFFCLIRVLYAELKVNIIAAILIAAVTYCLIAVAAAPRVPSANVFFWIACVVTYAFAMLMERAIPERTEPGHRSTLPVYAKVPIITGVVLSLILLKHHMQGFMAMFPMVSVLAAYETRHSLLTSARKLCAFVQAMIPMLIVCRLCQPSLGVGLALAIGWVVFMTLMAPQMKSSWTEIGDNP